MNNTQRLLMVIIMSVGTLITRFLVLVLFKKELPKHFEKIVDSLPYALMGMLVVYALKDAFVVENNFGLYELFGLIIITITYRVSNHVLLSIGSGLLGYLVLVNLL